MINLLVKHTVEDYEKWKKVFIGDVDTRKAYGSLGTQFFHEHEKPEEVTIIIGFDTKENAQKYLDSDDLKEAVKRAGVVGKAEINFLNDGEKVAS